MKKTITAVVVLLVLGVGGWIVYNVSTGPEEVAQIEKTEPEPAATGSPVASRPELVGTFKDQDAVHKGSGTAEIYDNRDQPQLRFGNDFSVTDGPDLFVYLSKSEDGTNLDGAVSLGRLKSNKGSQIYTAPENFRDFKSVVIYCKAFKVTFSVATLK